MAKLKIIKTKEPEVIETKYELPVYFYHQDEFSVFDTVIKYDENKITKIEQTPTGINIDIQVTNIQPINSILFNENNITTKDQYDEMLELVLKNI